MTEFYEPDAALHPFPEGWYFVASRAALARRTLIGKTWLGRRIVAWRDGEGRLCVAGAACPHLGSDLGPETGGRVRDGRLVCPFHGYEYDASGQCVATPYAPPPRSARLDLLATREFEGLVFAWHGIGGRAPQWDLPAPEAADDWGAPEFWSVRFPGHPQETTENSVDLAHLRYVHGYDAVSGAGPVEVDGARLTSAFDFRRSQTLAGIGIFAWDVSAVTRLHGLGYSLVEVREHSIGMDTRLWVLATPVDGELVEMTLVSRIRLLRKPKRPIVGMRFLPPGLRTRLMNKIVIAAQGRDVMQDVAIWGRKRYRPRPWLCRSDGEIGVYRRWCAQFYPDGRAEPVAGRTIAPLQPGLRARKQ
ncbi:MAG: Rieske 2Fe-2S domain-containing protein [Defluviicoccus sp.]|nr:Rieske 2Fe-2S domain-containing protein [Defluviicoccus sp.]MDE0276170.1 Rieske 2Fe-2S domain-containing protein [Defluviicoccus sp.]